MIGFLDGDGDYLVMDSDNGFYGDFFFQGQLAESVIKCIVYISGLQHTIYPDLIGVREDWPVGKLMRCFEVFSFYSFAFFRKRKS